MLTAQQFGFVTVLAIFFFVSRSFCQVTLNVPEYAMQGDKATIECRVSKLSPSLDSATISRNTGTDASPTIRTLATHTGLHPDAPSNVGATVSTLPDGTCRIILTISDVTRDDAATYSCAAGRQLPNGYFSLGSRTSYLAILYHPASNYPMCSTIPPSASLQRHVGDILQVACTSELANPHANVVWGRTGAGILPHPIEFITANLIRSELSVMLAPSDNGAQFVCISKSAAFPDYAESCLIGPVTFSTGIEPSTETANASETSAWQTETKTNSCNSSSIVYLLDMESPIAIGSVAVGGSLILIIAATCCVFCLVRCCKVCKKEKKDDADNGESNDINLVVVTNHIEESKQDVYEKESKEPSISPPKYNTLFEGKTTETSLTVKTEVESKPKVQPLSASKKMKEYPPPPNYPRPVKGLSVKSTNRNSFRDSQLVPPDVVVYGNLDNVTKNENSADTKEVEQNDTEIVTYGTISQKCPRSSPSSTKRLDEPFKANVSNGSSPVLGKKEQDGVVYGNLNSLTRKSTRSSPTPIRPNKAPPPPPPPEQGDNHESKDSNGSSLDLATS